MVHRHFKTPDKQRINHTFLRGLSKVGKFLRII